MLEFSVSNYRSIRDEVTLSMLKLDQVDEGGLDVVHVAGIYGANASGKTTVLESLKFLVRLVRDSGTNPVGVPLPDMGFAFSSEGDVPTVFTVTFSEAHVIHTYSMGMMGGSVVEESLILDESTVLFTRKGGDIRMGDVPDEDRWVMDRIRENTGPNNLFLSRCMQFHVGCTKDAVDWFLNGVGWVDITLDTYLEINRRKEEVVRMLSNADLGITDISIENIRDSVGATPDGLLFDKPMVTHEIVGDNGSGSYRLSLDAESHGTRVLLGYIPTILDSLDSGKLILMDELEAGLHPLIVDYLIGLFSSTETNPNGSQLLFTTHDTMIPRRTGMGVDQIWFASRDPSRGRTSLYPLSDFEIDDLFDFSQDYLDGRMGSIPMVRRV